MAKDKDDKPERRPVDLCWLEPRPDCKAPIVVILAKLVKEEGSTQPQLVGDLLPSRASALVGISWQDHLGSLIIQADLS